MAAQMTSSTLDRRLGDETYSSDARSAYERICWVQLHDGLPTSESTSGSRSTANVGWYETALHSTSHAALKSDSTCVGLSMLMAFEITAQGSSSDSLGPFFGRNAVTGTLLSYPRRCAMLRTTAALSSDPKYGYERYDSRVAAGGFLPPTDWNRYSYTAGPSDSSTGTSRSHLTTHLSMASVSPWCSTSLAIVVHSGGRMGEMSSSTSFFDTTGVVVVFVFVVVVASSLDASRGASSEATPPGPSARISACRTMVRHPAARFHFSSLLAMQDM